MEGKEHHNEEDENQNSKTNNEESDADDFGLPEIEDSTEESENLGDPYSDSWEEQKEDENFSDTTESTETIDGGYNDGEIGQSTYYEEEYVQRKSPVGWIIFGVLLLIAIIIGVFWWMNRDSESKAPAKIVTPQPVVEEPVKEEVVEEVFEPLNPISKDVRNQNAGVFEINEPTGRYQVIIASSIDVDLIKDYAKKLADQGMTCNILAPRGNKKFHRLSVANFASINDATIKAEELKSTFGENVWVIRY